MKTLDVLSWLRKGRRSRRVGVGRLAAFFLLLTTGLGFSSVSANAQLLNIASQLGLEGKGVFTGTLNYTYTNATSASLVLTLTNSLLTDAGGKITALAFNNPGNKITGVTLASSLSTMAGKLGGSTYNNTIKVSPWDDMDIGVTTDTSPNNNNSWTGGGSPAGGIARGSSATFTFTLTGTTLNTLTTNSFVNELNSTGGQFLAVRFKGFDDGGSDKVSGKLVPVPEPAFYQMSGLLLMGGAGVFVRMRRARKNAA